MVEEEWSGQEYDPQEEMMREAQPHKGLGTKAYERFWGTDVDEDPMEFIRLGSQLVGGVGGAILGAKGGAALGTAVGGPMGTAVGGGLGAMAGGFGGGMLGTAAPEGVMEGAEFFGIADEGTRDRLGLTDEELATVVEGESILDMMTGGGLMVARAGVRSATKAFVGMGLVKGGRAIKDTVEFAAEHGVNMLPVQVGKRLVPRAFVNVLGRFPLVAGPIRRNIGERDQEIKAAFENLPASIAPVATLNKVSHEVFMDAKNLVGKVAKEMDKNFEDIYTQADHAGARVIPTETASRVQAVIADIGKETPATARAPRASKAEMAARAAEGIKKLRGKKAKSTDMMEDVKSFLTNDIAPIFRKHKTGSVTAAPQTFRQMNNVLEKIDEKIASLGKNEGALAEKAVARLQRVRQAASIDMYTNVQGEFGQEIAQDLRALDRKYTETIADLFQTTAAKKFGKVRRGGLSHLEMDDIPTSTHMDNLTDVLMKSNDVAELLEVHRLVEPGTFRKMAAYSISKQVENAYTDGGKAFDLQKLSKSLGLDAPKGARYAHTKKMLELSGGLSMEDLGKLVEIGEMIGKVEAPSASTFLARKGVLGGAQGIVAGLLPTIAVHGTGSVVGGQSAAFISTAMFIGGSHMVGRMIADPRIARPLHKVLDKEARSVVKKGATLQMLRIFSNEMMGDGEWSISEMLDFRKHAERTVNALDKALKRQEFNQQHRVPTSE